MVRQIFYIHSWPDTFIFILIVQLYSRYGQKLTVENNLILEKLKHWIVINQLLNYIQILPSLQVEGQLDIKCTVVTLLFRVASDSQRHPLKLCLIAQNSYNFLFKINIFNCWFSIKSNLRIPATKSIVGNCQKKILQLTYL